MPTLLYRLQRVPEGAKTTFFPVCATVAVQELADMNHHRDENSICTVSAEENEILCYLN